MYNVLWENWTVYWRVWLCLICSLLDVCLATPKPNSDGHLLPLDQQSYRLGDIAQVEGFLDPETFYTEYVKPGKPVLFKDAAKAIPGFTKWTDEYLKKQYGLVAVDVEIGKKETRQQGIDRMPFEQFINAYKTEDIYMVQDVVNSMKGDLSVPKCLQCGGFQDVLEAAVIWFSSGGTKSVLHYDAVDNINCLFDGEKSLVMIDKQYFEEVEGGDGFVHEGGYSKVDVEKVDLKAFPQFRSISWWSANMQKGDCLFIPFRWYHTVNSSPGRNLAVNVWFVHRLWFNTSDCEERREQLTEAASMETYSIAGLDNPHNAEKIRADIFDRFEGKQSIILEDCMQEWDLADDETQMALQAFKQVDKNSDLKLDWSEVYEVDVIDLVQNYPFVHPEIFNSIEDEEEGLREEL